MEEKVGILNLGCARNLVDAEEILGRLRAKGFEVSAAASADVVIVNTCSFIDDAKKESINAILDLIALKKQGRIKKIVVAGCLAQRYGKELLAEFKEIDAVSGVLPLQETEAPPRFSLSPEHSAYVKICESCFHHCSFCVIPVIKGRFVSRSPTAVLEDVLRLDARGVKEINLIGQDITAYGLDRDGRRGLAPLLRDMVGVVKNIEWIRLLYAHPEHVTDDLLEVMARERKICKYLDLPLQHSVDRVLKAMSRGSDGQGLRALVQKVRARVPGIRLRTTFIVGFPGETEAEFSQLREFVREMCFDKLGVFAYSREEGTAAYDLPGQISPRVKERRRRLLMQDQQEISRAIQESFLGQTVKVLIDGPQEKEKDLYLGRTEYDAPDVDGLVYVHSAEALAPGDFVKVQINDTLEYDLIGRRV